ncbi:MAG: SDR family oxidoreductase [Bacteroidia bacterium]|nr:SDR family oxidoreductase [Bacteroidia bacterium]
MIYSLENKNALVCGSTSGIGRATAKTLAEMGANVILLARSEAKLKETLSELPCKEGQSHQYLIADFTDPQNVSDTVLGFLSRGNLIHILVNNTGGPAAGPVSTAEAHAFVAAFQQHLVVNHLLTQAVIPGMKQVNYGRIINIISTSVKQPLANLGVSNTIRAAVANWAKTMANELASFGITVNNVLPGATETERLTAIIAAKVIKTGKSEEEVAKEMIAEIPAGRFGRPEEIAQAVGFLASAGAAYITGINLPVDGGRTGCL